MDKLTLVAALPGSGAGYMSALPAEVGETKPTVQMKAPYFDIEDEPMVYVPSLGCFIPVNWPPIGVDGC